MAESISPLSLSSSLLVFRETDLDATANNDIFDTAAADRIYLLHLDNTANAAQAEYAKLYNSAAPTVGTTAPDMIIPLAAGATVDVAIVGGYNFATNCSIACVTAAGTAGAVSPTADVVCAVVGT